MKNLNSQLLKKFLRRACEELEGEWILIGGTLLPALGIDVRPTIDIDLVGLTDREAAQTLKLMEIAESLGLGIEVINQAASYYFRRVGFKKSDLKILATGRKVAIYRPSVELYWRLKVPRLTESDALDCQHYLQFCRGQGDKIDGMLLNKPILAELKKTNSAAKVERLKVLKSLLVSF